MQDAMKQGPKYDGNHLRKLTKGLLGDLTMKETLTNVVIPTFDIKHLQPVVFTTIDVRRTFHFIYDMGFIANTCTDLLLCSQLYILIC